MAAKRHEEARNLIRCYKKKRSEQPRRRRRGDESRPEAVVPCGLRIATRSPYGRLQRYESTLRFRAG